jgi:hypothetical protein
MIRAATFAVAVLLTIPDSTSHARRPSATVTGRVVDADLGTPIAGVNVGSRETGSFPTDRDGRFNIPDVRDGRYAVWIEDKYLTSSWAAPIQVRVENGRAPAPIEFRVRLEGSLSGRVTDERGEPVVNARVQIVNRVFDITGGTGEMQSHIGERAYAASELTFVARRQATSDSRGYYTIDRVPAGIQYRVLAVMPRRYPAPISDAPSDPAARPANLRAAYHPAAASFDAATDVVVHSIERKSGVDIRMRRAPSFCLEATLAPAESPGPAWFILEEDEASRILRIDGGLVRASGFTDAKGRLRVCDLYSGRFFFAAVDRVMPIAIAGGDVSGLTIPPNPPVTVSIEVVGDAAVSVPARLALQLTTFPETAGWNPVREGFSLSLTSMARYGIGLTNLYPWHYVRDITYARGTGPDRSIIQSALVPGESESRGRLRLMLAGDGGSISVRVRRGAEDIPYAIVLVWPADAKTDAALAAELVAGISSESGGFLYGALRPGRYHVLATHAPPPYRLQLGDLMPHILKTPETIALLRRSGPLAQEVVVTPRTISAVELTPTTFPADVNRPPSK